MKRNVLQQKKWREKNGRIKIRFRKNKKDKVNNKNSYEQWREFRKDTKENYIMIPTELKDYLPHIHTQAINLYLYYF